MFHRVMAKCGVDQALSEAAVLGAEVMKTGCDREMLKIASL